MSIKGHAGSFIGGFFCFIFNAIFLSVFLVCFFLSIVPICNVFGLLGSFEAFITFVVLTAFLKSFF